VTLVEGLILRRKVVAVDLNPLATFIMRHEVCLSGFVKLSHKMIYVMDYLCPYLLAVVSISMLTVVSLAVVSSSS